ncbi:MAG: ribosome-associated translation inhibitor RaiA [Rhodocyclaceae bacterium]|nr:ribosome-associated translation inhibitor RaiA [Rhodocyclaceae bacterium]MCP5295971.1 ribosome-associated translation inhibitor RaiA [Zoogloeaceae bacterium]PKO68516.1 MAG: ribosomal subunit interface protein [Betaproteobacteria bacterium HGW-Betaproteobacteria-14]MBX3677917.1 ribosome-associated translation inhibitor RaiA [Rhodocyclaceae bacterium]MCB1890917.1 ribosome-associated translation inhibitor RaiA [Rhodocyclaceae bacterium]
MQRPLQITFKDIAHSDAVEQHIREKAAKLETFYPNIIGCHVTVELPHKHHHQGKEHNVRIDIKVPGSEIVVNRDKHEDIYVALRDAFDAAKRQVEEYGRRQRGDVKHHAGKGAPAEEPAED